MIFSWTACTVISQPFNYVSSSDENPESLYEVQGYDIQILETGERETKNFKYLTQNIVLATGNHVRRF